MVYYVVYFLTKFVSFFYFPRNIHGHEHIPAHGGFILASNHISNLDPVVLGISSKRRINFMAKDTLFKGILGWVLPKLGAFPIKRGAADISAFKETYGRLNNGKPVLIFVEGTRRAENAVPKAQPGIGLVAVRSKVPVIPVFIDGTQNVMPQGSKAMVRGTVTVRFGPAIQFDPKMDYQGIAQVILDGIYSLQRSR